ncbi:aquaporin-like isoform X2 [Diorhabda carinulata]|uniref:aquaporin-like isoform X2 n=1 Tax=Diorhabda carinulata TaxID=1163345 RepID=UPI0025A02970|nr:aquaporin-like isoform X2 [Diorhabda carinulata]
MVDRQNSQKIGFAVIDIQSSDPKWITPKDDDIEENVDNTKPGRLVKVYDNMSVLERLVLCLSEFGGTACLVFLGCLGCTSNSAEQISFTFGLAIMIAVQIFGHISGSHINPAVTVAAAALGDFPLVNVPIYFLGQILGGVTGFGLVKTLLTVPGLCSPSPNSSLSVFQVFLTEFLLTLILIWVCCGVWDSRNATKHDSISIRLGLAVAGLAMAGGSLTGANMNPARSFGPAVLNGTWNLHWVYWAAPILAGLVGAISYRIVFGKESKSNETFPERPSS